MTAPAPPRDATAASAADRHHRAPAPAPPSGRSSARDPSSTAHELVAGLRANDPAASAALYRDFAKLVYGIARRRLGRGDLAEEAMQETMLRAWLAADRIDPERPLAPWLATIARRVAIDIDRRERRRATVPLHDAGERAAERDETARADTSLTVRAAIRRLEPRTAELARLHHYEGLTYAEVAERIDIPLGTVKSRCFRMRSQLQALLVDSVTS